MPTTTKEPTTAPESKQLGIKETTDVLVFAQKLIQAVGESLKDKRLGLMDLQHAIKLRAPAIEAIKDVRNVKAEVMDLDIDEVNALLALGESIKTDVEVMVQAVVAFQAKKK